MAQIRSVARVERVQKHGGAGAWLRLRVLARKHGFYYLLFLPAALDFIIFRYLPMFGLVIAFKDVSPFAGLEEAAIIDGASPLDVLWRVILPLSMPSIATIGLFYAVGHWNAWFDAAIYLKDQIQYPLQLILRSVLYLGEASYRGEIGQMFEPEFMPPAQTLRSAMIIVSTAPILVIYPFIQRYFVKGMLIGGIKG
jgi:ABC-type glycerol-3-phosphate transport system permease component